MPANPVPKVLVIGCGKIGMAGHLPALKALQDEGLVEVVACDHDAAKAQAAAAQFGAASATDWETAAKGADAAVVCLPPGPNAEVAAAAVRQGLHALCEKPPGRTQAQADALAEAQAEHPDAVTMVGFNRRFNPLYERSMRQSVELGPPSSFYGRFSQIGLGSPPDDAVPNWIVSSSSHAIDLAVATIGYPDSLSVSRRTLGTGPDNAWTVHLHGGQGSAVLLLHYAAGRRMERYEWAGPGYDVALDLPGCAEWAQGGRKPEQWTAEDKAYHHAFGFANEHRRFLEAIAGRGPRPACDFTYAAAFLRLVEAILATPDGGVAEVAPRAGRGAASTAASATSPIVVRTGAPRPVVLVQQPPGRHARFFTVEQLAALRDRCDVRLVDGPGTDQAWKEAQAVITGRGTKGLPADIAERSPGLELVVVLGASLRNYATAPLRERGVQFCNTADAVAQSVAEHCLMGALAGLRRLGEADRAMHAGKWPVPGQPAAVAAGRDLRGRVLHIPTPLRAKLVQIDRKVAALRGRGPTAGATGGGPAPAGMPFDLRGEVVGLVGWGHTARRFAELLAPFGCTLLAATEAADPAELDAVGARRAALGEVLASARVVSLHKGLTAESRGFLNERSLALLRPGSVLVNTARGPLIEEAALIARLQRGDIVAVLDVFDEEPLAARHPLRKLENVILTPHNASATAQEELRMGAEAIGTVLAWADGAPVPTIDEERLSRMT